jgi:peptidoglycan/LPS O-acetylase OafA/YrhL
MNRLQKKAWTELIACGVAIILIAIPILLSMAKTNVKGLGNLLIGLIVGVPFGIVAYIFETKKLKQFDEREKGLIQKAQAISVAFFVIYALAFSYAAFFFIGGKGNISVVTLPIMVLSGMFLAQCVKSAIILIQCEKEDNE